MLLEDVAVFLPDEHKVGKNLGIRMGSTADYVTFYVDGQYTGDLHLDRDKEGDLILRIFAPTTNPRYIEVDIHPRGKEEFRSRRNPNFTYHDFDWSIRPHPLK